MLSGSVSGSVVRDSEFVVLVSGFVVSVSEFLISVSGFLVWDSGFVVSGVGTRTVESSAPEKRKFPAPTHSESTPFECPSR